MNKQCPTCSNRKESFFADGTICPTCGRRASLFLDDITYSSGVRFDELESLKTALRIKTEEHDCCAEDNIELRKQLAAVIEERDEAYHELLGKTEQLLASQAREQQLRRLIEQCFERPLLACEPLLREALSLPRDTSALDALVKDAASNAFKHECDCGWGQQ